MSPELCLHAWSDVLIDLVDAPTRRAFRDEIETVHRGPDGELEAEISRADKDFNVTVIGTVRFTPLTPLGEATRLCLTKPFGQSGREALIERQRGCFLAIRGEWETYLAAMPSPGAEQHYRRARTLYTLARAALGKGMQWLERNLRSQLPKVAIVDRSRAITERGGMSPSRFLKRRYAPASAIEVVTLIRDAQVADRLWAPALLAEAATDAWGLILVGGPRVIAGRKAAVHLTDVAACLHFNDVSREDQRGSLYAEGAVGGGFDWCPGLVAQLFRAYRHTGSRRYLKAAEAAWGYTQAHYPETRDKAWVKRVLNTYFD